MFRRKWSGLPPDPDFPADFEKLGYSINPSDEIRSIANPKFYYKYFHSKNVRHNDRKRFAFDAAIRSEIHARLESKTPTGGGSFQQVMLPHRPGRYNLKEYVDEETGEKILPPRVPIYASENSGAMKHFVVIIGEPEQDLGVLAHRVIGGKGGIEKGSMVSVAKALRDAYDGPTLGTAKPKKDKYREPGICLANTGELWWWTEGKRGLTPRDKLAAPMRSSVMLGRWDDGSKGRVPFNRDPTEHVACLFEDVITEVVKAKRTEPPVIDIIAIGSGADAVVQYLEQSWDKWGDYLGCMAITGGLFDAGLLRSAGMKTFLRERTRAWISSHEPLNRPLSGPDGNDKTYIITNRGCPQFSAGNGNGTFESEMTLIDALPCVMNWMQEVLKAGKGYKNPEIEIDFADPVIEEPQWAIDAATAQESAGEANLAESIDWANLGNGLTIMSTEEFEAQTAVSDG